MVLEDPRRSECILEGIAFGVLSNDLVATRDLGSAERMM